jgi:microcystin-dependent protein
VPVASLQAGEYLDITLSNIRSNCASGFANIYINYEDIPGYWDSHFVVQVEKSPIVHRDFDGQRNVGIGKYPSNGTKLDVEGDAAFAGNVDIGILTGSAHDYNMAQNTISGGGIVSWNGKGAKGGLLWTKRFIAITAEKNHTFRSGYVDFRPPTTGIPASHVYDGKKRDYSDEKGLILDSWDALYAVHTPGGDHSQIEYRIQSYNKNFNTASHWFLIAVCNGDNNSIKLSSGLTLSMGEIVDTSKGLIPCGIIVMWNGTDIAIPAGWSLCNGSNGTPDLRDRFVVGAGNGSQYQLKSTGGADSVTLSRSQMPKHNHSGSATSGEHKHIIPTDSGGGGLGWGQARTISANVYNDSKSYANANSYAYTLGDNVANWSNPSPKSGKGEHTHKLVIGQSGSGLGHENRPPYYALCYIMKL